MALELSALEPSKENILPLKSGRSTEALKRQFGDEATPSTPSAVDAATREAEERMAKFESEIESYDGYDPLEVWLSYVTWVEQSNVTGSNKLIPLLERATRTFKGQDMYQNDPRYIKLWIKYAESVADPKDIYSYMNANKIGCNLAMFYEAWATATENSGNMKRADKIYVQGIKRLAQPIQRLEKRHTEFQARLFRSMAEQAEAGVVEDDEPAAHETRRVFSKLAHERPTERVTHVHPGALKQKPTGKPVSNTGAGFAIFCDDENGGAAAGADPTWTGDLPTQQAMSKENTERAGAWNARAPLGGTRASGSRPPQAALPVIRPAATTPFAVFVDEECVEEANTSANISRDNKGLSIRHALDGEDAAVAALRMNPLKHFEEADKKAKKEAAAAAAAAPASSSSNGSKKNKSKKQTVPGYATELLEGGEGEEMSFEEVRAAAFRRKARARSLERAAAEAQAAEEARVAAQATTAGAITAPTQPVTIYNDENTNTTTTTTATNNNNENAPPPQQQHTAQSAPPTPTTNVSVGGGDGSVSKAVFVGGGESSASRPPRPVPTHSTTSTFGSITKRLEFMTPGHAGASRKARSVVGEGGGGGEGGECEGVGVSVGVAAVATSGAHPLTAGKRTVAVTPGHGISIRTPNKGSGPSPTINTKLAMTDIMGMFNSSFASENDTTQTDGDGSMASPGYLALAAAAVARASAEDEAEARVSPKAATNTAAPTSTPFAIFCDSPSTTHDENARPQPTHVNDENSVPTTTAPRALAPVPLSRAASDPTNCRAALTPAHGLATKTPSASARKVTNREILTASLMKAGLGGGGGGGVSAVASIPAPVANDSGFGDDFSAELNAVLAEAAAAEEGGNSFDVGVAQTTPHRGGGGILGDDSSLNDFSQTSGVDGETFGALEAAIFGLDDDNTQVNANANNNTNNNNNNNNNAAFTADALFDNVHGAGVSAGGPLQSTVVAAEKKAQSALAAGEVTGEFGVSSAAPSFCVYEDFPPITPIAVAADVTIGERDTVTLSPTSAGLVAAAHNTNNTNNTNNNNVTEISSLSTSTLGIAATPTPATAAPFTIFADTDDSENVQPPTQPESVDTGARVFASSAFTLGGGGGGGGVSDGVGGSVTAAPTPTPTETDSLAFSSSTTSKVSETYPSECDSSEIVVDADEALSAVAEVECEVLGECDAYNEHGGLVPELVSGSVVNVGPYRLSIDKGASPAVVREGVRVVKVSELYGDLASEGSLSLVEYKPAALHSAYIALQLKQRLDTGSAKYFDIPVSVHTYGSDACFAVCHRHTFGTLADALTAHSARGRSMKEPLVLYYAMEMLNTVGQLHKAGVVHSSLSAASFYIRNGDDCEGTWENWNRERAGVWAHKGVTLGGFDSAIDTTLFADGTLFCRGGEVSAWNFDIDAYALCCILHEMLFGEPLQTRLAADGSVECATSFTSTAKADLWGDVFIALLNYHPVTADLLVIGKWIEEQVAASPRDARDIKSQLCRQDILLYDDNN